MTDAEVQDFVTRFAAAWAARDGNAFVDLWHPEGLLHTPLVNRTIAGSELIPHLIDQNPCAHWRSPMDIIFQGRSTSVFQA
jgi:hypothetical protein